jgi:plasmid stabilization system protein ParE
VNLFIQEAAEQDILRQIEWYAERGLPAIARRFHAAALDAIDALVAMPAAGLPKLTSNPHLSGLRSWPIKGFDEFRVYYLARPELLIVVRVLHGKRDIGTILESQELDER